jgi:hypothetical protein
MNRPTTLPMATIVRPMTAVVSSHLGALEASSIHAVTSANTVTANSSSMSITIVRLGILAVLCKTFMVRRSSSVAEQQDQPAR